MWDRGSKLLEKDEILEVPFQISDDIPVNKKHEAKFRFSLLRGKTATPISNLIYSVTYVSSNDKSKIATKAKSQIKAPSM